eukprot:3592664-Rhodomonas_salina.1
MNAGLARHARSVAEGWEAYGVEHRPVFPLGGNWYGKGGCGTRILHLQPSILHIDAPADSESCISTHQQTQSRRTSRLRGGMLFKDGAVPYERLHNILESISEVGKQVHLLVLMVSYSADGGRAE